MWYFLIFPVIFVLWRAYRFGGVWQIISSLAYIAVSGGISIGIFKTMMKQNLLKKKKKLIAYVVFAVLADQLIKVIIYQYQPDINLIGKALRIQMVLNREQSALYSFFNIHMQTAVIIIQKILIFGAVTVVYIKWKQKRILRIEGPAAFPPKSKRAGPKPRSRSSLKKSSLPRRRPALSRVSGVLPDRRRKRVRRSLR